MPWPASRAWGPRQLYDHELVYVLQGHITLELGERTLEMGPDHVCLIPPRLPQRFICPEQSRHIGIHFDWEMEPDTAQFAEFEPAQLPFHEERFRPFFPVPGWDSERFPLLDLRGRPRVRHLLTQVVQAKVERVNEGERASEPGEDGALLAAALLALGREARFLTQVLPEASVGPDAVRRVHRARDLLEQVGPQAPSVAETASRVGWSPDHLARMCRAVLGVSPLQLQVRARVNHAVQLLKYGALPVPEVARACGYRDVAYFSALFKAETGQTPRAFTRAFTRAMAPGHGPQQD